MIDLPSSVVLTYVLLGLATLSLWLPPLRAKERQLDWWPWMLGIAIIVGMGTGLVLPLGAMVLAGFGVIAGLTTRLQAGWVRTVLYIVVALLALALALHLFGGFVNPPIAQDVKLTAASAPFTARLNFDTAAAGIIVCGTLCRRIHSRAEWAALFKQSGWIVAPALVVNVLALLAGYALFEPKLPAYTPYFVAINLLFTCVTEEAFFRGFIQHKLAGSLSSVRHGAWIAIGVTALLFGLAHARGGATLVALATVAGVGYGLAYWRTGRIEGAIGAHIALNTLHFVMLSYPRAA